MYLYIYTYMYKYINIYEERGRNESHDLVNAPPAAVIDSGLVGSTDRGRAPQGQKMLEGHHTRVMYHQVY